MNLKPMRPGMPYSPETELREAIGPLATEIPIVDPEALPPAPNDAVIGTRAVGETISYTGKVQHGDGWRLTGVQRAVETGDVARTWNAGAPISRVITERDFAAIRENILSLCDEIEGGASPTGPPRVIHVALWHRSQHAPIQDHQLILTFERPTPAGHWVGFFREKIRKGKRGKRRNGKPYRMGFRFIYPDGNHRVAAWTQAIPEGVTQYLVPRTIGELYRPTLIRTESRFRYKNAWRNLGYKPQEEAARWTPQNRPRWNPCYANKVIYKFGTCVQAKSGLYLGPSAAHPHPNSSKWVFSEPSTQTLEMMHYVQMSPFAACPEGNQRWFPPGRITPNQQPLSAPIGEFTARIY